MDNNHPPPPVDNFLGKNFPRRVRCNCFAATLPQFFIPNFVTLPKNQISCPLRGNISSKKITGAQQKISSGSHDSDIGTALKRSQRDDSDNKASCLAKAASIVRKDMLEKKTTFTGTFEKNCQNDSIPQCLYSLVNMILDGPNIRKQAENKSTQATLTVFPLLQFNSYFSNRSGCSHHDHHNRCRAVA